MIYEIQPTITRKEWDIYTNNIPYGIQLTILIYSSTKPEHVFIVFMMFYNHPFHFAGIFAIGNGTHGDIVTSWHQLW